MYDIDFKEVEKIPFPAVLDYLGIPCQESKGTLYGKIDDTPFTVNLKKNLYWITEKDRGNVITFTAKVRGCNNYTAAKELRDHLMAKPQGLGNSIPQGVSDERLKNEEGTPIGVRKPATRDLTVIDEWGTVVGKLMLF